MYSQFMMHGQKNIKYIWKSAILIVLQRVVPSCQRLPLSATSRGCVTSCAQGEVGDGVAPHSL